jgi:hypothetical protein
MGRRSIKLLRAGGGRRRDGLLLWDSAASMPETRLNQGRERWEESEVVQRLRGMMLFSLEYLTQSPNMHHRRSMHMGQLRLLFFRLREGRWKEPLHTTV